MKLQYSLYTLLALSLSITASRAQETWVSTAQTLEKLKQMRTEVSNLSSTPEADKTWKANRDLINKAIISMEGAGENRVPVEYYQSLVFLKGSMENAKSEDKAYKQKLGELINQDLNIKFQVEAGGQLNTVEFVKLVDVNITTKGPNGILNNLRVRCSPLGFHHDFAKPYFTFPKLSSPVTGQLPPGLYIFWVTQDNDFTVLNSNEVEVIPGQVREIEFLIK